MKSHTAMQFAGYFARPDDATDADLLQRFVAERDGEAFAALVRRHGPMVFGVCRRVLGDWHRAEDAFQAAFVVLARRAAAVSPPGAVAGWLHGVAHRVAKEARRSALRIFQHERPVDAHPESQAPPPPDADDLSGVLDDELRKLPGKYRQLLVACDLEGRSRQPVAESLGIPEGTLSSRLTVARKMLANRLAKRGIAPAVVAGIAASGPAASAMEFPRTVLASTARIGTDAAGTVPAAVATLANGAIRAMTLTRLITASVVLFGLGLPAAGAIYASGVLNPPPAGPADTTNASAPILEEKPLPVGPNRILFFRDGKLTLIDPDGKNEKTVSKERELFQPVEAKLSPDGKRLAVRIKVELPNDPVPGDPDRYWLYVRELDEKEPGTFTGVFADSFAWSPDGAQIAWTGPGRWTPEMQNPPPVSGIVTVATSKNAELKLPAGHRILDWSRDGKFFLTQFNVQQVERKDEGRQLVTPTITLHLMNRDGTEYKRLTDPKGMSTLGRLSPDRKRVLYYGTNATKDKPDPGSALHLWVLDLATEKAEVVANVPDSGAPTGFCWSPDGDRVAYSWREHPRLKDASAKGTESEFRLVVCDPDGKNVKTIVTEKRKGDLFPLQGEVDWR